MHNAYAIQCDNNTFLIVFEGLSFDGKIKNYQYLHQNFQTFRTTFRQSF